MTTRPDDDAGPGGGIGGSGPGIPGYRDFFPIAQGGFSIVYTAYQDRLDRTVAVKVINSDLRDAAAARRFRRECKVVGKLTGHPNIVTVFEAGSASDRRPFIAMQYLPRGSIADRLKRETRLGVAETLRLAALIADALQVAHEAKILHRDVKPGNVLLSERGDPVLSDFGIASRGFDTDMSASQDVFTPSFAAPEIVQGAEPTVASDLYGLGATMFAMLTGEPPFGYRPGDSSATMMLRVLTEEVPSIGRPDVDENVEGVVRGMLARDPSLRPRTAAAVATELRRLHALHGFTARPSPPVPDAAPSTFFPGVPAAADSTTGPAPTLLPQPAPSGRRRAVTRVLGVAAGVVLVVLVVAAVLMPDEQNGSPSPSPSQSQSASVSGSADPGGVGEFDPADVAAARPRQVAVVDEGASLLITWTNGSVHDNIVVNLQETTDQGDPHSELLAPPSGATVFDTPVDPASGYCVRVGVLLGLDPANRPVWSWSDFACVRGAKPPHGQSEYPS